MGLSDTQREFFAGLLGGLASVLVCHPLDVTRTMMNIKAQTQIPQVKNRCTSFSSTLGVILQQQGIRAFYKGLKTTLIAIPFFHSIYFPIYGSAKKYFRTKYNLSRHKTTIGAAFVAGILSDLISNPLWVARTRVMVQVYQPPHLRYRSTFLPKVLLQIVREEGFFALYKGLSASIFGLAHACIYFSVYQALKYEFNHDEKLLTNTQVFLCSCVSKLISCTATYPHIVIRTLMHDHRLEQTLTVSRTISNIARQKGIAGFYLGLKPDLIRVIPANAITFVVYQMVKRHI